ncbi:MAG: type II toxin-antitoxin system HicA family toxin [Tannerella sp.]|nr:type II toxin-antitoxin system HicA family toxin [Tannerella sp.]
MKSRELDKKVQQSGAKFLYQDASSHKYYELNGLVFSVPYHGAKEVPSGTCAKILKIIKGTE